MADTASDAAKTVGALTDERISKIWTEESEPRHQWQSHINAFARAIEREVRAALTARAECAEAKLAALGASASEAP